MVLLWGILSIIIVRIPDIETLQDLTCDPKPYKIVGYDP